MQNEKPKMKLEERVGKLLSMAAVNGVPKATHILVGIKERAEMAQSSSVLSLLCGKHSEPATYQGMIVVPVYEHARLMIGTLTGET